VNRGKSFLGVLILSCAAASGCGYAFKGTRSNPALVKENVRTIFIETLGNDTFKPGVENLVLNQLLKAISYSSDIRVVNRRENADAILRGTVTSASFGPASTVVAKDIFPQYPAATDRYREATSVANLYAANLSASLSLEKVAKGDEPAKPLWAGGFTRSKVFPGNPQMGVFGTTAHLINESEFDRALADLASEGALDATENLFSTF
jgi:hypothetical protein